ncbi:MAG: hypothetical protein CMJ19_07080 [Phycisphaeraceae bacterium]|nr:hypothetical protein [Phycisphaeraceae bacterium]
MDTLHVCTRWIDEVFRFKGVKFCLLPWLVTQSKQSIIINFIDKLCQAKRSKPPHNMVMFLDFDTEHSKFNIQNHIREVANIARCYHLDSKNNDCIQCCDMLMNASERIAVEPTLRFEFNTLQEKLTSENRLKDSEVKKYLAGYLGLKIDTKSKKIYDLCRK